MSKPLLGMLVGTVLGLLDGASALLYPEAAPMIVAIVIGSTVKGLVTGLLCGLFARKLRSLPAGIGFGLAVGLALSYLAAASPDPEGRHHYLEIMLPGAVLGLLVGFATQRYGRVLVFASLALLQTHGVHAQAPTEDPWRSIRFMVGTWDGESDGDPGNGTVKRSYRFVLKDKFLLEENVSTYPAQPKNPKGEIHEHRSFFSYDRARKTLVLRQFHQEGFVNQYAAKTTGDGTIVFESEAFENIPPGWKARETYEVLSPDEFTETFELAMDGKPFAVYSRTRFKRAKP